MVFLATNVLVYAALNQDPHKHATAAQIVRDLLASDSGAISAQVVNEFTNTMFKKTTRSPENIRALNGIFRPMLRLDMTAGLVDSAISLKQRYGLQYYDSLIVAAAQCLNCDVLYSEDMSDGAVYDGVKVITPFR